MSKYHAECTKSENERKKKQAKVLNESETEETQISEDEASKLMGLMNPNRACTCEVMARAVRADVSKYLGLSERRAELADRAEQTTEAEPQDPNLKSADGLKQSPPPSK